MTQTRTDPGPNIDPKTKPRRKLIEVALPLPEVNDASAYDKMPGIGPHPKGIHQWWARLPLPTARAVLFASVVDDPGDHPEKWPTQDAQDEERERLLIAIREMMGKKQHQRPEVYRLARQRMLEDSGGALPTVFDPFAGGGSIPLEAARLGFEAHAGDLNPVAVLLNKCNLEIAPRWSGHPPVNPSDRSGLGVSGQWQGTAGLAADVRFYGGVIGDRARVALDALYPRVRLPTEHGGSEANVVAWVWARTVPSPDPSMRGARVPLLSTYWLSKKKGGEAWLRPVVDRANARWHFEVGRGAPQDPSAVKAGTKTGRAQFRCLLTGAAITDDHIKREGTAGRMGSALVAIVAEGRRSRVYLESTDAHIEAAKVVKPDGIIEEVLPDDPRNIWCPPYGLRRFADLFSARQLNALAHLSRLIRDGRSEIERDARAAGLGPDVADTYARAITTFLALALDRCADFNNALCRWNAGNQKVMNLFGRQAIPMVWDFAEANIVADVVGGWSTCGEYVADCIETITAGQEIVGQARQIDAATGADGLTNLLVSTDPPYYDNISYANLADFFYVWLRPTIGSLYPDVFGTVLVPKLPELTASPERFGGSKQSAKDHFEAGFQHAFTALRERMDPRFPLTVYYAFKQADEAGDLDEAPAVGSAAIDLTTGWETLLEALVASGFQITATWPVRASQAWRMRAMDSNALASYIVLACRPRPSDAPDIDRRTFGIELKNELPMALRHLQQGNIAPVDFAQAAIGPGMAIYSRYSKIVESGGNPMTVRSALTLINRTLTELLSEAEDEFDTDTRWAIAWFEQHGFGDSDYGSAELLSKAKVTSVGGLQQAGILNSKAGKVRLLRPEELPRDWEPRTDMRRSVWESTHHLIRAYLHDKAGDEATAMLLRKLGADGDLARDLAYRLYAITDGKKRSQDAQMYNALVLGWPELARLAREMADQAPEQTQLFGSA